MSRRKRPVKLDFTSIEPLLVLEEKAKEHLTQKRRAMSDIRILLWTYSKLTTILPGNKLQCSCGIIRHFSAFHLDHIHNNGSEERFEIYRRVGWKMNPSRPPPAGSRFLEALALLGELEAYLPKFQVICACCHSEKNYSGGQQKARAANAEFRNNNNNQCTNELNTKTA